MVITSYIVIIILTMHIIYYVGIMVYLLLVLHGQPKIIVLKHPMSCIDCITDTEIITNRLIMW